MTSRKFAPGEVTPEQLEKYKEKYEAALENEVKAYARYWDRLHERKAAESIYVWAKQGMVEVTQ
jgi:hypothetical protein